MANGLSTTVIDLLRFKLIFAPLPYAYCAAQIVELSTTS
jgi:hypothetical protein